MQLYKDSSLVRSNLGRLIAAQHYWDNGWYRQQAVFHLLCEQPVSMPDIAALATFLQTHRFSALEVEYLASLGLAERFLNALQRMIPLLTMSAVPSDFLVSSHKPILILKASYIEAQVHSIPILYFLEPQIGSPLQYECVAEQAQDGNWHSVHANPASIVNFEQKAGLRPVFKLGKLVFVPQ